MDDGIQGAAAPVEEAMSLVNDAMEPCVMLDKKRKPDGEGGYITEWTDSVEFEAAITFDDSMQARIGAKSGVTSLYTVTLPRGFKMDFHDVFRRLSDGKIFRVTSDGDDKHTPGRASFQFSQVTAEEWTL